MPTEKARELADGQGLDLVEVSPTANPPVCRIIDYGKYKYEQSKRERQSKKKQHTIQVKEIKLRPKTEEHDYQFKKKHAEEFLSKGFKVKFTIIFRGRELDHKDMGARILARVKEDLAQVGVVERAAMFEGRLMTMFLAPVQVIVQPKKASSKTASKEASKETSKAASKETSKETSKAASKETSKETSKAASKETSKEASKETSKAASKETSKEAPKKASTEASKKTESKTKEEQDAEA